MHKEGLARVLELLKAGYYDDNGTTIALLAFIAECLADIADTLRGENDGQ